MVKDKADYNKKIALERIKELFKQAEEAMNEDHLGFANRYVSLARKLGMKYKIPIPSEFKKKYCHHCYHFLKVGKNVEVRVNPEYQAVEYICQDCKHSTKYGYSKEKKK